MCKCICSAANMHPSMKHLSMVRAGLPPFFLIFFLLICLLRGKITCLGFSPVVTGLLSLGTSFTGYTLAFLSCLLLWADCPNSQIHSQVAGQGLYCIDNMRYFILSFLCISCILHIIRRLLLLPVCWGILENNMGKNEMTAVGKPKAHSALAFQVWGLTANPFCALHPKAWLSPERLPLSIVSRESELGGGLCSVHNFFLN